MRNKKVITKKRIPNKKIVSTTVTTTAAPSNVVATRNNYRSNYSGSGKKYNTNVYTAQRAYPKGGSYLTGVSLSYAQQYMSPFAMHKYPPANPQSMGNFLTVDLVSSFEINTVAGPTATDSICVVFQPSSRSIYQVNAFNLTTGATINASHGASPTFRFSTAGDETTPVSMRPLRAGVMIKNITQNDQVGGLVKILQQSSALPWAFSPGSANPTVEFCDSVREAVNSHHRTKEYTGKMFSDSGGEIIIAPCTSAAYNSYGQAFVATEGTVPLQVSLNQTAFDMAMNTVIMVFNSTVVANKYNIKFGEQVGMRFPTGSLIGQQARTHPPAAAAAAANIEALHETLNANPEARFGGGIA